MKLELWKRKWEKDICSVSKEVDMKQFREYTNFVLDALQADGFLVIPKNQIKKYFPNPTIKLFKRKSNKSYTCSNCGLVFEEKNGMVQCDNNNFDSEKCYQEYKEQAKLQAGEKKK
jgi:rubredoxin